MTSVVKVLKNAGQFWVSAFVIPVRAEIPKCSDTRACK
jgi:hypothetical protein